MRGGSKEPLYRRVNTRTHGVHHGAGGEARWDRRTKGNEAMRGSMHPGLRHGLDYTPLYRFLLSRIGRGWDEVLAEVLPRLENREAVFHMVARTEAEERDYVRLGQNSYWSGLRVNELGQLEKVAPDFELDDMVPGCACCTHTFNGARFTRAFDGASG